MQRKARESSHVLPPLSLGSCCRRHSPPVLPFPLSLLFSSLPFCCRSKVSRSVGRSTPAAVTFALPPDTGSRCANEEQEASGCSEGQANPVSRFALSPLASGLSVDPSSSLPRLFSPSPSVSLSSSSSSGSHPAACVCRQTERREEKETASDRESERRTLGRRSLSVPEHVFVRPSSLAVPLSLSLSLPPSSPGERVRVSERQGSRSRSSSGSGRRGK